VRPPCGESFEHSKRSVPKPLVEAHPLGGPLAGRPGLVLAHMGSCRAPRDGSVPASLIALYASGGREEMANGPQAHHRSLATG